MKNLFRKIFPDKEQRAYNKMHRRHRRELVKHAKKTNEWDWYWLHDSIIMQIGHMYEYYAANNNVWQSDETRLKIIEQLKYILYLEKEIDRMQDDNLGAEYTYKDDKLKCTLPDDYAERLHQWNYKEQKLYEELYSSIGKNLRYWWD